MYMDNQQETKVIKLRVGSSEAIRLTYLLYDDIVLYGYKDQILKINPLYLFNGIILLPTYVSGNKNKMGFCHLSTNCNKNSNVRTGDNLCKAFPLETALHRGKDVNNNNNDDMFKDPKKE